MRKCDLKYITPEALQDSSFPVRSMADVLAQEPEQGVYTVGRTYQQTKVMQWDDHVARLRDSAHCLGWTASFDASVLRRVLREMILAANWGESRFRLFVAQEDPAVIRVAIEPFFPPYTEEERRHGARCVTMPGLCRDHPDAKQASWTSVKEVAVHFLLPGIHTGLLLNPQGYILEGLDSNFFAIRDGRLYSAEQDILIGLSLRIVWQVAPAILTVVREPVSVQDIPFLEEAFLSSSSRGILPVTEIDGKRIGSGQIGPHTRAIQAAFQQWITYHLEEL